MSHVSISTGNRNRKRPTTRWIQIVLCLMAVLAMIGFSTRASAQFYEQTNLVSDVPGKAINTDTNLLGAWGTTHSSTSPWWVNTTVGGTSLLFNGAGVPLPLVVTIPPPAGHTNRSSPTGVVFNGGTNFQVMPGKQAVFIFATRDGTISGWNPGANATTAIITVSNSPNASYTGLAIFEQDGTNLLFAANFGQDRIDVFNGSFQPVTLPSVAFVDDEVPNKFSVFNIQLINGMFYVTYAPKDLFQTLGGRGQGYVSVFNLNGDLQMRLRHGFWMDAPWGVTLAPKEFGKLSNHILVGMFGSGQIAAFDTEHGNFHGLMRGPEGQPITMGTGLWGLGFGNGSAAGPADALYFAADFAFNGGLHGLFGTLTPLPHGDSEGQDEEKQ